MAAFLLAPLVKYEQFLRAKDGRFSEPRRSVISVRLLEDSGPVSWL